MPRVSRGRKKVEITKIENWWNRRVTFSKRRDGLFKKASELCIMCGIEIAIVTFAPNSMKVYSFGHPSVYEMVDRYLARHPPGDDEHEEGEAEEGEAEEEKDDDDDDDDDGDDEDDEEDDDDDDDAVYDIDGDDDDDSNGNGVNPEFVEAYRNVSITRIANELMAKEDELAREIKRGKELETVRKESGSDPQNWWEAPLAKLNYDQLQEVMEAMKTAQEKVQKEAQRLKMEKENIKFPYSNFGSALAPRQNFDANEPSGSGSTS